MNRNYTNFLLFTFIGLFLQFGITNTVAGQQGKNLNGYNFLGALGNPTITTNKTAYESGDEVIVGGSGYRNFEEINIAIDSYDARLGREVTLSQWSVYSDYRGQFSTNINFDSLSAGSGSYKVRALGTQSKSESETVFSLVLAASANIDQCRNGSSGTDQCTGNNWVNGNIGSSNSNYVEGEFVPYRMLISGAAGDGTTVNTLIIEYDTTQSGKHAIDYIGTYNSNETNANPCDYAGCPFSGPSTSPIPVDPLVTNGPNGVPGGGDDIAQVPGNVTIWGGTITNVALGSFFGTFAGNSSRQIVITFTSTVPNPVLSWGGHISRRIDWGINSSAVSLPGSPYHMRLISINGGGGSQDRSMSVGSVLYPAIVTIIKNATPNAETNFTFNATGPGVTSPFILDDDAGAPGEDNTYSNSISFSNIQSFGAGNEIVVTESATPGWTLQSISCVEQDGGLGTTADSTTAVGLRNVTIRTQEAEIITCTFVNDVVLAAGASVNGTITDSFGYGISNTRVQITNLNSGEVRSVLTSPFGFYQFDDMEVGESYLITVTNKRYQFSPDSRVITINEDAVGVDFTGAPR